MLENQVYTLRLFLRDVDYTIECLPEDTPVRGNSVASGDDEYDRKVERKIERDLDRGNEWAWCCVRVTARLSRFKGEDYLGGCSYSSQDEFCRDGYFQDMKAEALADLIRNIKEAGGVLECEKPA